MRDREVCVKIVFLFCPSFLLFHFWCINIFYRFLYFGYIGKSCNQNVAYVERSQPIIVSGSHDVDFTHGNKIVHYFQCMRIDGYFLWYSRRRKQLCLRLETVSRFICYWIFDLFRVNETIFRTKTESKNKCVYLPRHADHEGRDYRIRKLAANTVQA